MYEQVQETVKYVKERTERRPKIAIILGSGLGDLVERIEDKSFIEYKDIPNFPVSTVAGHKGRLVFGKIGDTEVMAMQGRFHFYEGYHMREVTYPQYFMKEFGIENVIVSNAAGGANKDFTPGDLMIISDHMNLFGTNPLIGKNDERFGPRFPDLSEAYNKGLILKAKEAAAKIGLSYKEGVYAGLTGPCYETAAEVRYLSNLGADAVGMSTVPEVIVANYLGMKVLGFSCITNMATGIAKVKHSHEEVVKTAIKASERFCDWVVETVKII